MPNKFIARSTYRGTFVAGLSDITMDDDSAHFSFAIYVDEEEFCQVLDNLIANRFDNEKYDILDEVVISSPYPYDTTRLVRNCDSIYISRGNLKIMYAGSIGSLNGLTDVIRKVVKDRDSKYDKELNT